MNMNNSIHDNFRSITTVERSTTLNDKPREYVPYQLCPKCNGEKVIPSISPTNPTKQCDICGGLGIIPMAKI